MMPAHLSYAAWMMKSAESSAGLAPATFATQSGALSMMAGIAVLPEVAPARRAHGPLYASADDGEHDRERYGERQHLGPRPLELGRLAVGQLAPRHDRGLDERAVGLQYLLVDHAHLRVHERAVLDEVEALELDGGGHAQEVQPVQDQRRDPAAEEPERQERRHAHQLPADRGVDVVQAGRVAGGEDADPEHPEEARDAVDGDRPDGIVHPHLGLDPAAGVD